MAVQTVGRGGTIPLDAFYRDGTGNLVTPGTPRVDIIDPNGMTVVNDAVPTELSLGHFQYEYTVASDALLGLWTAHWTGTINDQPVEDDDYFEVAAAGDIDFTGGTNLTCQPWASSADVCSPCDDYTFDTVLLLDSLQAASDVLFKLSGQQYPGVCTATVRPCSRTTMNDIGDPWWNGSGYYGGWWGWLPSWGYCSCNRGRECGCSNIDEIELTKNWPVVEVTSVKIDGATLDASEYSIHDRRYLVRNADSNGNKQGWPCCQRLDRASTEEDTFEVSFAYGRQPPGIGVRAAAKLGCELALGCQPETVDLCHLPKRITNITRLGVSMSVLDPFEFLEDGKTGIYEVDLFLRAVNPNKMQRPSGVWSPDYRRTTRRITG